jgi:hypothetical protein
MEASMKTSTSRSQGIVVRWRRWLQTRAARRLAMPDDGFVGPLARPVWPFWVDAAQPLRRRREPQRSDPPHRARAAACGWFESSVELRAGLEVREELWLDLPAAGELDASVRFL